MKYQDIPSSAPGRKNHVYRASGMGRPARRTEAAPPSPPQPPAPPQQESLGGTRPIQAVQARPAASQQGNSGATRVVPKQSPRPAGKKPPKKPKPSAGKTVKIVVGNIFKTLLVMFCVMLIAGSLLAVQVVSYIMDTTADDDVVLDLETLKLPQTGYILAQDPATGEWIEYQKLTRDSNSIWVQLDQIPQQLQDAVISTEDREFLDHKGVSFKRTLYALVNEVFPLEERTFGASTIDQQLVKNITGDKVVVGPDGSMEAGYQRKIREIFRAWGLNTRYSKDMIMEAYLNTLPLSGTIVGVQAGAIEYFNKDVKDLTLAECALVAGITQSPGKYNPFTNPENALKRRNDVLFFMLDNGKISQAEFDEAVNLPLGLNQGQVVQSQSPQEVTSYFTDAVFEAVVGDLVKQGICDSREAAIDFYYTQGLRIEATVDLTLQAEMERVYALGWGEGGLFPPDETATSEAGEEVHPQSAMAVVRYDGTLAGVVGAIGEKKESLGLNRATQSPRPIGSTMKPLAAYSLGIEYGIINYSTMVADTYVIPEQNWPVNYGPRAPSGRNILVSDAIAQSLNSVPAHIGEWVGIEEMYEFLSGTLGISTLVNEGPVNDHALSPLVLGGMTQGVTPAELAAAYTMFGGEESYGMHTTLHCYERVTDSRGNIVMKPEIATWQAISPENGYIMNRLLSNVLRGGGTASGMALDTSDSVGKTGTTSDDKDRWFVGLSPYYVTAVWWGYDQNEVLTWPAGAKTNPPPVVWHNIIDTIQEALPEKAFPERPAGVVERAFCRDSGLLAGDACGNRGVGYYTEDNLPLACPGTHVDPAAAAAAAAA